MRLFTFLAEKKIATNATSIYCRLWRVLPTRHGHATDQAAIPNRGAEHDLALALSHRSGLARPRPDGQHVHSQRGKYLLL